jgi:hypothetical protein
MNYSDPYEVLGIDKTASMFQIRKAYRDLAKKYHPDINADAGAAAMTAKINAAYNVLIDPEKKFAYDNRYAFLSDESDVDFAGEDPVEEYDGFKKETIDELRERRRKRTGRESAIYSVVRRLCYPIALFSFLIIFDYFLPVTTELDYPLYGYQTSSNGKYSAVSSFMKTQQHEFEVPNTVHVDYEYDAVDKKLLCMEFTPIFNTIKRIGVDHGEYALMYKAPGTIYLPWLLPVPYVLLMVSIFFITQKKYTRLRYALCFLPIVIALIYFALMIFS